MILKNVVDNNNAANVMDFKTATLHIITIIVRANKGITLLCTILVMATSNKESLVKTGIFNKMSANEPNLPRTIITTTIEADKDTVQEQIPSSQ
jgi:hypothetical protein